MEPGHEDPRVTVLAQRLTVTGYLNYWQDGRRFYDDELRAAVLAFQACNRP